MKRIFWLITFIGILVPQTAHAQYAEGYDTNRVTMVSLVNQFRQENGLNRLIISPTLSSTAQDYAKYLNDTGQFEHNLGQPTAERAASRGWMGWGPSENLSRNFNSYDAFASWKDEGPPPTPGDYNHYSVMLLPGLTHLGVGVSDNINVLNVAGCSSGCDGFDTGPIIPPPAVVEPLKTPNLKLVKASVKRKKLALTITTERFANGKISVVLTGPKKYKKTLKASSYKYNINKYSVTLKNKGKYYLSVRYQGDDEWTDQELAKKTIRVS